MSRKKIIDVCGISVYRLDGEKNWTGNQVVYEITEGEYSFTTKDCPQLTYSSLRKEMQSYLQNRNDSVNSEPQEELYGRNEEGA